MAVASKAPPASPNTKASPPCTRSISEFATFPPLQPNTPHTNIFPRFMKSDPFESGYFNEQIVLAAKSLGFEEADCDFTQKALDATFGNRCSPAAPVIPASAGPQLQAICVSENCPLDPNATCSAYPDNGTVPFPAIANATLAGTVVKENDTSDTGAAASLRARALLPVVLAVRQALPPVPIPLQPPLVVPRPLA